MPSLAWPTIGAGRKEAARSSSQREQLTRSCDSIGALERPYWKPSETIRTRFMRFTDRELLIKGYSLRSLRTISQKNGTDSLIRITCEMPRMLSAGKGTGQDRRTSVTWSLLSCDGRDGSAQCQQRQPGNPGDFKSEPARGSSDRSLNTNCQGGDPQDKQSRFVALRCFGWVIEPNLAM